MTYAVTQGTTKAVQARQWGDEMVRACHARNVTLNELGRKVGHGHTAIDHYRKGSILPRTDTAMAISELLNWPKLAEMIVRFRTFPCERCRRPFRNDSGGPKRYCSVACRDAAESLRIAERRRRQAGQTDTPRLRNAATARMKGVIGILQGEIAVLHEYVAGMCRSCEPEGLCRTLECPLRPVSPLPFHRAVGEAETETEVRTRRWTPAHRERHRQAMKARWAQPGAVDRQSAKSKAWHAALTAESHQAWTDKIRTAKAFKQANR